MGNSTIDKCSSKPNCVSSIDERKDYFIEPFNGVSIKQVKEAALKQPGTKVISETDSFLHMVFTTKIMRYKDDVKFSEADGKVEVSSQSRKGYSDLGANRKRVEKIRKTLKGVR